MKKTRILKSGNLMIRVTTKETGSNYTIFASVYQNGEKTPSYGTSFRFDTTDHEIKTWAKTVLKTNVVPSLKKGQSVTINIPFEYIIGDVGYFSNKVLKTIEDCKAEVVAEINAGTLYSGDMLMTVGQVL